MLKKRLLGVGDHSPRLLCAQTRKLIVVIHSGCQQNTHEIDFGSQHAQKLDVLVLHASVVRVSTLDCQALALVVGLGVGIEFEQLPKDV